MNENRLYQQLDAYTDHLVVSHQLSPSTVAGLRHDCLALLSWCTAQQIDSLDSLTSQHLQACLHQLQQQGLTGRALHRWQASIRRFFDFAAGKGWPGENPAADFAPTPGKVPGDDWLHCRDQALGELLTGTGLRFAELVKLDLSDVDLAAGSLHLPDSGHRLALNRQTLKAVQQWLTVRGHCAAADNPALFISQRGTRLAARSIQDRFQRLNPTQFPHTRTPRHTAARPGRSTVAPGEPQRAIHRVGLRPASHGLADDIP